jgi:RNA-directed DNA polymerase
VNSIRLHNSASLLGNGEAQTLYRTGKSAKLRGSVLKRWWRIWGGWRRNDWKVKCRNQGYPYAEMVGSMGVRAFVVAKKSGNGGGAKGGRKIDGRNSDTTKGRLAIVEKQRPRQAREAQGRWSWVGRSVWTDSMLTALDKGVRGGKWFSLIDKVCSRKNLEVSWEKVRKNQGSSGVDRQGISLFERHAEDNLHALREELKTKRYTPKPVRRVYIPKPGSKERRPLGVPTVRDRVVQTALGNVLEPIFEKKFVEHSYGFRPRRSSKDSLRRVQELLDDGYHWVVDADIEKYFDTNPPVKPGDQEKLMEGVEKEVSDGRVLDLIRSYLKQPIMDELKKWEPEGGTPQGAVISPLLANIYLHPIDEAMQAKGYQMVRYADDLVILCKSQAEAQKALTYLSKLLQGRKLRLNPEKTHIVDATGRGGFDFLGYHFERGYRWPRKKSIKKLREAIRAKTKRTNGNSMQYVIAQINPILRGWFNYFKHSYKNTFPGIDGWVRMRLRSILRKRRGGIGVW